MTCLLDTNVISELARPRPSPSVLAWASALEEHRFSAISIEEIRFGIACSNSSRLRVWADQYFAKHLALPVTDDIARRAGTLRGDFRRRGITRAQSDMLIAATAQAHGLTLVTRNTRDFDGCGIALLNPFTD